MSHPLPIPSRPSPVPPAGGSYAAPLRSWLWYWVVGPRVWMVGYGTCEGAGKQAAHAVASKQTSAPTTWGNLDAQPSPADERRWSASRSFGMPQAHSFLGRSRSAPWHKFASTLEFVAAKSAGDEGLSRLWQRQVHPPTNPQHHAGKMRYIHSEETLAVPEGGALSPKTKNPATPNTTTNATNRRERGTENARAGIARG